MSSTHFRKWILYYILALFILALIMGLLKADIGFIVLVMGALIITLLWAEFLELLNRIKNRKNKKKAKKKKR